MVNANDEAMAIDTFICGVCNVIYHDFNSFFQHKVDCGKAQPQQEEGTQVQVVTADDTDQGTTEYKLVTIEGDTLNAVTIDGSVIEGGHIILQTKEVATPRETKKKAGRPRKGQEKTPRAAKSTPVIKKPPPVEPDASGKLTCPNCKKSFTRQRHYSSHKCMAASEYIDLTKKESLGSDVEGATDEEEEGDADSQEMDDKSVEFKTHKATGSGRGRGRPRNANKEVLLPRLTATTTSQLNATETVMTQVTLPEGQAQGEVQDQGQVQVQGQEVEELKKDGEVPAQPSVPAPILIPIGDDYVPPGGPIRTSLDQIPDLPVFTSEEERLEFEENLAIDYSPIEQLYQIHIIEQDINEHAAPMTNSSRLSNELSIFSCNVCNKVFKSQSHMKLHCFIHTDLKPFKCYLCDFSTNSKGNLYSHMRRHTGQVFRCNHCKFMSVNKAHLLEHEGIHSKEKHQCNICRRNYNTVKSLINHIRKYHAQSAAGKNYLATYQVQNRNEATMAVLHQCHICNRKFKKKCDRDRHLFAHNLRDIPNIHVCELCDHTASRRCYMEKHYRRHRVVYYCSICDSKFLSSILLTRHLEDKHQVNETCDQWVSVFEECINRSLFQPEPDGSMEGLGTPYVSPLANQEGEDNVIETPAVMDESDVNSELTDHANGVTATTPDAPIITDNVNTDIVSFMDATVTTNPAEETDMTNAESMTIDAAELKREEDGVATDVTAEAAAAAGITEDFVAEAEEASLTIQGIEKDDSQDPDAEGDAEGDGEPVNMELETQKDYDIFARLKFWRMNMQVYEKMRALFGNEECEYCGRLFIHKADYEPHIRTHTGDKPFVCEVCNDYRSTTSEGLKRHIEKEHEKVQYVCNVCNYVVTSRTQLWYHQQKHKDPTANCPHCDFKCTSLKRLRVHLQAKHPEIAQEEIPKLTGGVKQQGKLGKRTFKCPYCEKTFLRTGSDLQKHIWIHEGIKPYKCHICSYACRSKNNLSNHMLRHSDRKPFACHQCGKAYKSKTALRWHVRMHSHGKMFKCHKCPYEASQNSHLRRHMETHNIRKKFVCRHCDFSANTIGYMRIHHTRHHPGAPYNPTIVSIPDDEVNSNTKVYKCVSCDYIFGNLPDMRRHLKIKHRLQLEDLSLLDVCNPNQVTQIQYAATPGGPRDAEVQVMVGEESSSENQQQETLLTVPEGIDVNSTAGVSFIQQIIDMSQQQVDAEGEPEVEQNLVSIDSGTVILQDGQEIIVPENYAIDQNQYIIQYVTADGEEVTTELPPGAVLPEGAILSPEVLRDQMSQEVGGVTLEMEEVPEGAEMISAEHVIYSTDGEHLGSQEVEEQVVEGPDESVIVENGEMLMHSEDAEAVDTNHDIVQLVVMSEEAEVGNVQMMET